MPLAPVGGTMCAASPTRYSRAYCIGSTTKLRIAVMPRSRIGPDSRLKPSRVARHGAATHAVKPVAARDDVGLQLVVGPVLLEAHAWTTGVQVEQARGLRVEDDRIQAARVEAGLDEVLDDLLLAVDHDGPTA